MFQVTRVKRVVSIEVRDNISCINKQLEKPGPENWSLEPVLAFKNLALEMLVDAGAEFWAHDLQINYEFTHVTMS